MTIQLPSKIERWHRAHKVHGSLIPAKNMPPTLGYRGQQWGRGAINSGPTGKKQRFHPTNAKPKPPRGNPL